MQADLPLFGLDDLKGSHNMALKFMKNNEFLSPTRSSPEKIPHPLATNLRTTNIPSLGTADTSMGTPVRRGVKRGHESSEEENSSDEVHNNGRLADNSRLAAHGLHARRSKLKRPRTGEHKWTSYHSKTPRRDSSSDEDEEEEMPTPSPLKRTGLNIGALSLVPPEPTPPVSSEYAGVNGFLKMLHMNRGLSESRDTKIKLGGKDLMHRSPGTLASQKSSPQKVEPKVDEQKEKDTVTSIYEEANRALGRLMLDRRKPPHHINPEGSEDDDDDSIDNSDDTDDG